MRILLCNDDGIRAEGLRALAEGLTRGGHTVVVSAPAMEQSCSGHSLTLRTPLLVDRATDWGDIEAYAVHGTPADCARLGLCNLAKSPIDLVVTGVNHGSNLGSDTVYSGTVSAAMEAAMLGKKALAVSLCAHRDLDFGPAVALACRVVALTPDWQPGMVYNLNVPPRPLDEIRGVRRAPLSMRRYDGGYEERVSTLGSPYYWSAGVLNQERIGPDTDTALVRAGWATITPLQWNMTDRQALVQMPEQLL